MVATNDIVKVVVGGVIGTSDRWSTATALKVTGGTPSVADMNGIANGAAVLFATDFWDFAATGYKQFMSTTTSWDEMKTYFYPAGSSAATVSGFKTITPDFGITTIYEAPQVALVASLETGLAGRKNRGRNYLPAGGTNIAPGRALPGIVTALSVRWAAYITALNAMTVGALSFKVCIGTGSTPLVTDVRVDNILDTQRRRRDKQVASQVVDTAV